MLGHPLTRVGEPVEAMVKLTGATPFGLRAHIVRPPRAGAALPQFAIRFDDLSADAEDLIHQIWLASHENPRPPAVLVVARSRSMRRALAQLLEADGWRVISAGAPLEAMDRMLLDEADLRWIIVLDRLTQTSGIEFLTFVGDAYPGVRRLLISRPDAYRAARGAVNIGVADAALLQPVGKARLEQIIGHG